MEKIILPLLLAAVIVSGCTSTTGNSDKTASTSEAIEQAEKAQIYTVKYQQSGFNPGRIVVRTGDKVNWINRAGKDMQITFPRSGDCENSEETMNSCTSHENYTLSFEESGTYNFYNEKNPGDRGMVIVNKRGLK